jgi:hypothetical protein
MGSNAQQIWTSGGLIFVEVPNEPASVTQNAPGSTTSIGTTPMAQGGVDPLGFVRVLVIRGGINLGINSTINQEVK